MSDYKPIESKETIETIINNNVEIDEKKNNKYRDPKNQIPNHLYKVIKLEKNIKSFNIALSFSLFITSIILLALAILKITPFSVEEESGPLYGYIIAFSASAFISIAITIKNTIELTQWNSTINKYRESLNNNDKTSSNNFHITYRKIALKDINLLWLLIFTITYVGLVALIIFGLYKSGAWTIGNENSVVKLNIDWKELLDNAFGNTQLFCILLASSLGLAVVLYILIILFDKKRLADIVDYLGDNSSEIYEKIETAKKERNKAWMKAYFIIVCLTILLPLALILYAAYRGIIKRKAAV
ncbi:Uncharacterised protein [Mycoplasmopsis maculosa]|uniref:Uncharacterized protein n=1 Tax=Mycoplasmopsis maculosa TaxID=114885 RepID=A0A449B5D3_9BACT|nr:hypothetical protein [Mycoplasmopsis maculosa]VEU75814.1 Uncharacterised protein [Mycoplasmopsis maculosa]